jgi:GT2 family glycosyltransferase
MRHEGDVDVLDGTGDVYHVGGMAWRRDNGRPAASVHRSRDEVFSPCAAAALYRRTMLDDVAVDGEIFDASFFAYLEDNDLDWRGRLRGWKSWYDPRAVAIHRRGGTGAWYTTAIQRHILKNRLLMIAKNDAGFPMLRRAPGMLAFTLAKSVQLLVARPAALLGFVDVLRLLPATLHKRRIIQKRRTVAPQTLEPWFQPYPYIQKIREGRLGRSRRPSTSLS